MSVRLRRFTPGEVVLTGPDAHSVLRFFSITPGIVPGEADDGGSRLRSGTPRPGDRPELRLGVRRRALQPGGVDAALLGGGHRLRPRAVRVPRRHALVRERFRARSPGPEDLREREAPRGAEIGEGLADPPRVRPADLLRPCRFVRSGPESTASRKLLSRPA